MYSKFVTLIVGILLVIEVTSVATGSIVPQPKEIASVERKIFKGMLPLWSVKFLDIAIALLYPFQNVAHLEWIVISLSHFCAVLDAAASRFLEA